MASAAWSVTVVATHSFRCTAECELSFAQGDVASRWWTGCLKRCPHVCGWFPANYVRVEPSDALGTAVVYTPFAATTPMELDLVLGETIFIVDRPAGRAWWWGESGGRRGMFPSTHVKDVSVSPEGLPPSLSLDGPADDFDGPDDSVLRSAGSALLGARLRRLVGLLTREGADPAARASLLRAYRPLVGPYDLAVLLSQRFRGAASDPGAQEATVALAAEWARGYAACDMARSEQTRARLWDLAAAAQKCPCERVFGAARQLAAALSAAEEQGPASGAAPEQRTPRGPQHVRLGDVRAKELARQLAVAEFDVFGRVSAAEVVGAPLLTLEQRSRAPAIAEMVDNASRMSGWVVGEILKLESPKERAKLIKYFISVAQECRALGNFNGLVEIIAGLHSTPIRRLSKSWKVARNRAKTVEALRALTLIRANNYAELRVYLESAPLPCLPPFAILHSDLVCTLQGTRDYIPSTFLVNWKKVEAVAALLQRMERFQSKRFPFVANAAVQNLLSTASPTFSDEQAMDRSHKLEPYT
eukprot:m51a1_g4717 hypothetical protein (531) ;mRNA; r:310581-312802